MCGLRAFSRVPGRRFDAVPKSFLLINHPLTENRTYCIKYIDLTTGGGVTVLVINPHAKTDRLKYPFKSQLTNTYTISKRLIQLLNTLRATPSPQRS